MYFLFLFWAVPCGLWDLSSPNGLNLGPQLSKHGVLATGPPGNPHCCFFWFHWVFVAVLRLSLVGMRQGYSGCGAQASHWSDFSVAENGL